jgi:ankyrin repeat protein
MLGKRVYSALFAQDDRVRIEIRRAGYRTREIEIDFTERTDLSLRVELDRLTPVHSAARFLEAAGRGEIRVVREYLESGGDPNGVDQAGLNALAYALGLPRFDPGALSQWSANHEMIRVLLEAGTDLNLPFYVMGQRLRALHVPVIAGLAGARTDHQLVGMLLESGAAVDAPLETGTMRVTPLAMTVIVGIENRSVDHTLVQLLLESGADPAASVTYEGRVLSPLSLAVVLGRERRYEDARLIQSLVQAGAPVNTRVNIDGAVGTPLFFAEQFDLGETASVLRAHGGGVR